MLLLSLQGFATCAHKRPYVNPRPDRPQIRREQGKTPVLMADEARESSAYDD